MTASPPNPPLCSTKANNQSSKMHKDGITSSFQTSSSMTRQAAAPPMMTIVLVAVVVEEEAATQMGARSVAEHSSLAAPRTGPVRISAMTRHSAHHVVGLVDLHCIRSSVLAR